MLALNNISIFNLNNNNPVHIQTTRRTQPAVITQFWTWIRIKVPNKIDRQINANDVNEHLKNCKEFRIQRFAITTEIMCATCSIADA